MTASDRSPAVSASSDSSASSVSSVSRPKRLVGVAGTGTDIGKTYWSVRILRGLVESGATVQVRKAAQSFEEGTPESETDAGLLGAAAQLDPKLVCPTHRWYPVAMAPPIAAAHLSLDPISLDGLVAEIEASWSGRAADFALVETAGGVRSPLADRGAASGDDCAALLSAVRVDEVLLIADAGLGTIHAVRASLDRLAAVGFPSDLVTVGLSRFDAANPVHASNLQWLQSRDGLRVLTAPEAVTSVLIAGAPIHCVQCGEVIGRRRTGPRLDTPLPQLA